MTIKSYLFPAAFAFNGFSLSLLVVISGLSGASSLAADLSLAQASMIAVFFSLSANARNLILKASGEETERSLSQMRGIMAPVLACIALFLSIHISQVDISLSLAIVCRQLSEWFSEIELAHDEKGARYASAKRYLYLSIPSLFGSIAALLFLPSLFLPMLFLWALLPLAYCIPGIRRILKTMGHVSIDWRKLIPNYASTFIIGTVVLFFRLLIAGFSGKETAGQLFTAFAIGSLIGSVYEKTIGPSLAVSQSLSKTKELISRAAWGIPVLGMGIIIFLLAAWELPAYLATHLTLFSALGFSLVGGFIMVGAQEIKISLLHSESRDDVFMGDLVANFGILLSVPVVYLLFGEKAFVALFLINSLLVYFSYWLISGRTGLKVTPRLESYLHILTAFAVLAPVFFQLSSGIYHGRLEVYDWGGALGMLPLPLSMFLCFPLILFMHSLRRFRFFSIFTFLILSTMLLGTILSSAGDTFAARDKVLLSLQCIIPFFGLILAEHAGADETFLRRMAKVFLWVTVMIAGMQILVAVVSGLLRLSPDLYLFSIYGNSQYVAVVMVSAFLIGLISLYPLMEFSGSKSPILFLPIMCLYVALSWSMLAIGLLAFGVGVFLSLNRFNKIIGLSLLVGLLAFTGVYGVVFHYKGDFALMKQGSHAKFVDLRERANSLEAPISPVTTPPPTSAGALPTNIHERVSIWKFYAGSILNSDIQGILFGHPKPPPRQQYPSAHNYYLDVMYNFGLFTLLPVLSLLFYTVLSVWKSRRIFADNHYAAALASMLFFMLFVENLFKVGLRQPYSGIYSFFLWGLLLSFLRHKSFSAPKVVP